MTEKIHTAPPPLGGSYAKESPTQLKPHLSSAVFSGPLP